MTIDNMTVVVAAATPLLDPTAAPLRGLLSVTAAVRDRHPYVRLAYRFGDGARFYLLTRKEADGLAGVLDWHASPPADGEAEAGRPGDAFYDTDSELVTRVFVHSPFTASVHVTTVLPAPAEHGVIVGVGTWQARVAGDDAARLAEALRGSAFTALLMVMAAEDAAAGAA